MAHRKHRDNLLNTLSKSLNVRLHAVDLVHRLYEPRLRIRMAGTMIIRKFVLSHCLFDPTIVGAPLVGALPCRDTTVTVADQRAATWIAPRAYGYSIWSALPNWHRTSTVGTFVAMSNQVHQTI